MPSADSLGAIIDEGIKSPAPSPEISVERRGRVLRALRELQGLTLGGVAERSGLSEPSIKAFEQGKEEGDFESTKQLAQGLGLPASYLMMLWELAEGTPIRVGGADA